MLHFKRLFRISILVFGIFILPSCSLLMAPISPLIANMMVTKQSKMLKSTKPKMTVLLPQQIASVKRIAVMPFENLFEDAKITEIHIYTKDVALSGTGYPTNKNSGRILGEVVEEKLLEIGTVDIVERSRLNLILKEQSLMQSGIGGDATPEIVAATAGAEAILLGSIIAGSLFVPDRFPLKFGYNFYIKARLIDTRNGKIMLTISDNQLFVSSLPSGLVEIIDHISKRIADSISAALIDSRKKYPDAKPPTRPDYLNPKSKP